LILAAEIVLGVERNKGTGKRGAINAPVSSRRPRVRATAPTSTSGKALGGGPNGRNKANRIVNHPLTPILGEG